MFNVAYDLYYVKTNVKFKLSTLKNIDILNFIKTNTNVDILLCIYRS